MYNLTNPLASDGPSSFCIAWKMADMQMHHCVYQHELPSLAAMPCNMLLISLSQHPDLLLLSQLVNQTAADCEPDFFFKISCYAQGFLDGLCSDEGKAQALSQHVH